MNTCVDVFAVPSQEIYAFLRDKGERGALAGPSRTPPLPPLGGDHRGVAEAHTAGQVPLIGQRVLFDEPAVTSVAQIVPDFPPNLATLAVARCSQGCQIGWDIWPNLATLALTLLVRETP